MKKIKLTALLSLLLITAMLLAACGGEAGLKTITSFDAVLNPDYDLDANLKTNATPLDTLDDYSLVQSNDNFAVFEKEDSNNPKATNIKVLSLRTGAVVVFHTSDEETEYSVSLSETTPTFTLYKRYGEDFDKTRYTLYDTAGNAVESTSSSQGNPSVFADMILYGTTLYEEDENGNLIEVKTIPENLTLSAPDAYSKNYFYYNTKYGIMIYDRDFNFTANWDLPHSSSYLKNEDIVREVLNNGNVLIQYAVQLDDEATEYDFTDVGDEIIKYDLCTLILDPKTGKTSTVETNYIFYSVISAFQISEYDDADNRMFSDSFENIAEVCPIVDKRIDASSAGLDHVFLNNKGAVTTSLMLVEHQSSYIPTKIANDTYLVSTEYGRAIVDGKGNLILDVNNASLTIIREYIISKKAVYNLNMEVIYDLDQNNATWAGALGTTLFIVEELNDTTNKVIRLTDGEMSTVCTIDTSSENPADHNNFTRNASAGYYAVYSAATEQYSYFNAKGTLLITSDYALSTVTSSHTHGTAVLKTANNEYYLLSK